MFNSKTAYRVSALLLLLLAFALRMWALDARSSWFDEAFEYWAATSDLANLSATVRTVLNDPPLYTLFLHFWLKLGREVFLQRYLSVIVSMLGVVGVMLIGHRVSGRRTALVSALLMAVMPSQIRYAQDAGQYVWMSSFLAWNIFALLAISKKDTWIRYLWWLGTALATSYLFYGAVFTVAASVGAAFLGWVQCKDWSRMRRGALAVAVYVVGVLPLVFYFLPTQLFRGPTANAFVLNPRPFLQELQTAISTTADLLAFQFTGWPWTGVPLWLTSILLWPLIGLALYRRSRTGWQIAVWLFFVWITYYLLGYIRIYPYSYRYGLILTPLLVPVVAQGIENLRILRNDRWTGSLVLTAILGICLISLPNRPLRDSLFPNQNWPWPETSELQSITQSWIDNRDRETPTYVYYGAIPAFRFYLNLLHYESDAPPPAWIQNCSTRQSVRPVYCNENGIYYGGWSRNRLEYQTQEVLDFVSNRDQFWIVFAHIYGGEDKLLLESLSPGYTVVQHYQDIGASIYLLQRQ